jgi:hypothetical protein
MLKCDPRIDIAQRPRVFSGESAARAGENGSRNERKLFYAAAFFQYNLAAPIGSRASADFTLFRAPKLSRVMTRY